MFSGDRQELIMSPYRKNRVRFVLKLLNRVDKITTPYLKLFYVTLIFGEHPKK